MNKLLVLSFRRIVARLGQEELTLASLDEAMAKNNIADCGAGLFYRLPQKEFKHIASIPCPVNEIESPESQQIVASSKMIRHHAGVREDKICYKCPFKESCPSAKKPFEGEANNTVKHLLTYWIALNNYSKVEEIYFRQLTAAYKLGDSVVAILNDLAEGGKEIEQYERLRIEAAAKYVVREKDEDNDDQTKRFEKVVDEIQKINKRIPKKPKVNQEEVPLNSQKPVFGRDYSFDEEEDIRPSKIYKGLDLGMESEQPSRPTNQKPEKRQTRQYNRSYITPKEEDTEDYRPQRQANKYDQRRQYDRPGKNYRQREDNYERENKRYDQRQFRDNYERQPRKNDYREREQYDQYDRPQKNYRKREEFNNYRDERRPQRDQFTPKNKFQKRNYADQYAGEEFTPRKQQYESDRKYSNEGFRNPKEQDRYIPKQEKAKGDRKDPFIKKWKPEADYPMEQDFQTNKKKPQWKQESYNLDDLPRTPSQPSGARGQKDSSYPKIVEVEGAEDDVPTRGRASRAVRRGSRGRSSPQDE